MRKTRLILTTFLFLSTLVFTTAARATTAPSHLKYFGYYGYDQMATPSRNFDEVTHFGNTNITLEQDPPGISRFPGSGKFALVDLRFISMDWANHKATIAPNWQAIWQAQQAEYAPYKDLIYGFYIDEPVWNGISRDDFLTITRAVHDAYPDKAIMAIEAYPTVDSQNIPADYYTYVTDLGFDYYFTLYDSDNRTGWGRYLDLYNKFLPYLQNKKVWVVADGSAENRDQALRLPNAFEAYFSFAQNTPSVVGLLVFTYKTHYPYEYRDLMMTDGALYTPSVLARQLEVGKAIIANGPVVPTIASPPPYKYDPNPPVHIPGDLNADGHVDIFDYNLLVSKFGNPYTIFDYNNLVANYGKTSP